MEPQYLVSEQSLNGQQKQIHSRNIQQAFADYNARQDFFSRRRRNRRFLRGNQWGDMILDNKEGDRVTEETYLQRRGRLTTKNNRLDPIVRNLVGQFRESYPSSVVFGRNKDNAEIGDTMTEALRTVEDLNEITEIDVQQFREALISGAWGNRVEFEWFDKLATSEVSIDPIEQPRFAYNSDLKDIRMKDLKRWCYLHDLEIDEIIQIYAKSNKDADKILEWYGRDKRDFLVDWNQLSGADHTDTINFYVPTSHGKHRVVEVWRKEHRWEKFIHDHQSGEHGPTEMTEDEVAAINAERVDKVLAIKIEMLRASGYEPKKAEIQKMRESIIESGTVPLIDWEETFAGVWYCYHYTPWGDLLYESETPYDHRESPIELYLHPMIDGEVYGLIETIIDQQKYFNRSISMLDFLLTSSAKGVLMIDKNMIPKEYLSKNEDGSDNMDKFLDKWVEFDGVIYYESDSNNPGNMPQHIVNQSMPVGLTDMLTIQNDLLKDISGVLGPVAGNTPPSGTPASLYMQQVVNASMTNRDIFESFYAWMRRRNRKTVQCIKQFWTEVRYIKAGGQRSLKSGKTRYDPHEIAGVDFDLVMSEGAQSAVFRQVINEELKELLVGGLITLEEYLEESSSPYASTLLEKVRDRKQREAQAAQEMQEQGMDPAAQPMEQLRPA